MSSSDERRPGSVDVRNIDEGVLAAALASRGLEDTGSLGERIGRLAAWVANHVHPADVVTCEECGGASDITFEVCPFCSDPSVAGDVLRGMMARD
jgi:hypothetical protein